MPIPEAQLETWSHQGSVAQSRDTYSTVRSALEASGSGYADKSYSVFLQGSYGNDTNIYRESDVDVVIRLDSTFFHDLTAMPEDQQRAFHAAHSDATYSYSQFKSDVVAHLHNHVGAAVKVGSKAVTIDASGNRRKSDVLAACQYRRYYQFRSTTAQNYTEGICFFTSAGERVANYPKQHSLNCTTKHQATGSWFKPLVRILKNLRNKLIADGSIDSGLAPSYYLEGLLYNVPNDTFGKSYADSFENSVNWLVEADRSDFVCANEQYYLLRNDLNVTWSATKCEKFLDATVKLANKW